MNLQRVLAGLLAILGMGIIGGVGSAVVLGEPSPDRSGEIAGPLTIYRDKAGFDPDGRLFMLWEHPCMVTQLHQEVVEDFIRRPGAGISRLVPREAPRDWVELVPESLGDHHASATAAKKAHPIYDPIREIMTLPDGSQRTVRERVWLLHHHQLMSVTAETGPAVYVLDAKVEHERMQEKKTATSKNTPTRKLDVFETAALAHLREGNDVVLQSSDQAMRAVGAIRARQSCLECHKGQVGDLLGAFSYKLGLQSEATPPADCLRDTAGLAPAEVAAVRHVESLGGKVVRTPGGPITEIYFTHTWNQDSSGQGRAKGAPLSYPPSKHVRLKNSSLRILESFADLRVLDVTNSLVTDDGLKDVAKLKSLRKLVVTPGYLTDAGLAELKKVLPDCEVVTKRPPLAAVLP